MTAPVVVDPVAFLDSHHFIWTTHEQAWLRDERRLHGGDAVLDEVVQFSGESELSYGARKQSATYVNFPKAHASVVTGQLRVHGPTPEKGLSFGQLGEIRSRDVMDTPTLAELLYYNVDGVGSDGSEFPAFMDGVDERAQATGHRWLMMETPQRENETLKPSEREVLAGFRPYVVEYSPLEVTNWFFRAGQLQFAIIRTVTEEPTVQNGQFLAQLDPRLRLGYYLLVRQGYQGLGPSFTEGGWWLFDYQRKPLGHKPWLNTQGQIPMWAHYGEKSLGTTRRIALSRSSTMELGQIAVSLMNTISARDYDAWDAAASRLYFLGADSEVMQDVARQVEARSMMIGVPVASSLSGNQDNRVQVYDGSMGAVAANVFDTIIKAKFDEAREQSFQKITSTPDSTGISKMAGHQEEKAPYLARRAALRQGSENTLIYFAELRSGFAKPTGYSIYPREFDLQPVVDDIDAAFTTLRLSGLRTPTGEAYMAYTALLERGLVPSGEEKTVEQELKDAAQQKADAAAQSAAALATTVHGGSEIAPVASFRERIPTDTGTPPANQNSTNQNPTPQNTGAAA